MYEYMNEIAAETNMLAHVRSIGAITAADLITDVPRYGYQVFQQAAALGVLLRPLGNTLYWFPPLNIEKESLSFLKEATLKAIRSVW